MRKDTGKKRLSAWWAALVIAVLAAALLCAAAALGRRAADRQRRMVGEPNELYYPVEPYTGPASQAQAAKNGTQALPQSRPEKGGTAAGEAGADSADEDSTGESGTDGVAAEIGRRAQLSGQKVGWGQGVQLNEKNQPLGALDAQQRYGDLGAYFIFPEAQQQVYLTFDLGYENGYTADILDALHQRGVHGVFFVTMDYVRDAPELVQRIIDEGHILGNHSVHHPSLPECSESEAVDEVMQLHEYVREHFGGYEMTLFRFPRGEFSERTLALLQDLGYTSVFWSYAYVDWKVDEQPDVAASLQKLTKAAHPGAIYLLHTVSATNAALLGDLVDALSAAGYTVGTLPH